MLQVFHFYNLSFFLPLDYNFNEVKYFYIKNAYRSICDDYGEKEKKI